MDVKAFGTAVFGIGGAGCKIIGRLSGKALPEMTLIALDKDEKILDSLGDGIEKVSLSESLNWGGETSAGIKKALSERVGMIEGSLEGVGLALVVVGLGGKTGTCMAEFIADLCERKNIPSLFIPIYPLNKLNGSVESAESVIRKLRDRSNGVIIVDNNLKRGGGKIPMLQVFERINDIIIKLVEMLVVSISDRGDTNMTRDELMQFFYGDVFFILTSGSGYEAGRSCERATGEVSGYADPSGVRRVLLMIKGPRETSLSDMKGMKEIVEEALAPDEVKWITSQSAGREFSVILVSAVDELPLIEGVRLPDQIEPQEEDEEETKESARPDDAKPEGEVGEEAAIEPADTDGEANPTDLPVQRVLSPNGVVKSPALIGMGGEERKGGGGEKEPAKVEPKEEGDWEGDDDLEEMINDLTGFPNIKKKGQKKLDEYDGWGIDYI